PVIGWMSLHGPMTTRMAFSQYGRFLSSLNARASSSSALRRFLAMSARSPSFARATAFSREVACGASPDRRTLGGRLPSRHLPYEVPGESGDQLTQVDLAARAGLLVDAAEMRLHRRIRHTESLGHLRTAADVEEREEDAEFRRGELVVTGDGFRHR